MVSRWLPGRSKHAFHVLFKFLALIVHGVVDEAEPREDARRHACGSALEVDSWQLPGVS